MPAPRNCRACGAVLPTDLRWCGLCFTPTTDYTPREPVHRGDFVGNPKVEPPTTRFARSPTTFGPVGRVLITVVVLAFVPFYLIPMGTAFFALGLWGLLAHTVVAMLVLKHVWRRVRLDEAEELPRYLLKLRAARQGQTSWLTRRIVLPTYVKVLGGIALAGLAALVVSQGGRDLQHYTVAAVVLMIPVGLLLAWLIDQ